MLFKMEVVMPRKSATAYMTSHGQNADSVSRLVKSILGQAGCPTCGRIALLHIDFISDPAPEFVKEGVMSLHLEGIAAK